jgi:2-oxoglutarate dehydrogenase complex dehydrogenase (E1) component-like enzyme
MPSFTVSPEALESRIKQSNFYQFVTAYRQHGHKKANVNPIAITEERFVCVYVQILHYDGKYSVYSQKKQHYWNSFILTSWFTKS